MALTALAMKGDREKCLEAGMDAYVSKPVLAADLLQTLELLLPITGGSDMKPDSRQEAECGAAQVPAMDEKLLAEYLEGDADAIHEVLGLFLGECQPRIQALESAIQRADTPEVARAAHTLKGSLQVLAAHPAAGAALKLETMGRCGDLSGARQALDELRRELARLMPLVEELRRRKAA